MGEKTSIVEKATNKCNQQSATSWYFALILIFGIAAIYYIYSAKLNSPVIRSDGEGYYAYLPAIILYQDVTLRSLIKGPLRGNPPQGAHLWPGTNSYLIKYPAGEALLMLPFFGLAYVVARLTNESVDGYAWPFQFAAALSGLFYTIAGLFILNLILQKYFRQKTILVVLTACLFGTNLFHYATYDAIFSHTYSFFLFCLLLFFIQRLYVNNSNSYFIGTGAVGGLIVITRPSNALWLLFGFWGGIDSWRKLKERLTYWKNNLLKFFLLLLSFLCFVLIQMAYWKAVTGSCLVDPYLGESFNFTKPEIINVLFSVRKGLFFWCPLLLTIIPGIFYIRRMAKDYFLSTVLFFPLNVYVISSWYCWWYGGSFGQRPFVESTPMFAIALCSLLEGIRSRFWRGLLLTFLVLAIIHTSWLMLKYWHGIIPFDGTTWEMFIKLYQS